MDKWLLNTKKIQLAVSMCDTTVTGKKKTDSCANEGEQEAHVPWNQWKLPENYGHFPNPWTKDQ
jgi:hypothetical protein